MLKVQSVDVPTVPKGWGYEKIIVNKKEYCGKLLHMDGGKQLSFHYHLLKDETFWLNRGKVIVKYGISDDYEKTEECTLEPGDTFYVPIGLRHRLIALEDSDIFEFSTQHFDSDSIRVIPGDQL